MDTDVLRLIVESTWSASRDVAIKDSIAVIDKLLERVSEESGTGKSKRVFAKELKQKLLLLHSPK